MNNNLDKTSEKYNNLISLIASQDFSDLELNSLIIDLKERITVSKKSYTFYYKNIIKLVITKIKNITVLINELILKGKPDDFIFILDILEDRVLVKGEEDLILLINNFLNKEEFNKIVNQLINNSDSFIVTRLINLCLISKNSDLLFRILDSKKIKNIDSNLVDPTIEFLTTVEDDNFVDNIVDQLSNKEIIFNDNLNYISEDIKQIYERIYVESTIVQKGKMCLRYDIEDILLDYSSDTIVKFIKGLNNDYINRESIINPSCDIMSYMIRLKKEEYATEVFEKENYQPINKKLRRQVMRKTNTTFEEFSYRLNNNIRLCLKENYFELILKILSSKKVDIINIMILHEINAKLHKYNDKELRDLIVETIIYRVSTGNLTVYNAFKIDEINNLRYNLSVEEALYLINESMDNSQTSFLNSIGKKLLQKER